MSVMNFGLFNNNNFEVYYYSLDCLPALLQIRHNLTTVLLLSGQLPVLFSYSAGLVGNPANSVGL